MTGARRSWLGICGAACGAAWLVGCQSFPDAPVTFLSGLRVLGMKADPPQAAPGGSAMVTVLAIDTSGETPAASWTACLRAPLPGNAVNPDCVQAPPAPYLQPLGDGLTIAAVMPEVAADSLGAPDATGGVYLPLVANVSDGQSRVPSVYRWRLADTGPANTNPTIATIDRDMAGTTTALDDTAPTPVSTGDALALGATFAAGSAEAYTAADGRLTTETLTTSWFCTAGSFSVEKTSAVQPQTVLHLDQRLPPVGSLIDLYAVARDERGGTDFTHRVLELQ